MVGVADPLVNADVGLAAGHLDAVGDRLHGAQPLLVVDVEALQAEHAGGVDLPFLVHLEGVVDQRLDLVAAAFGPGLDALVNQLLGSLQALVEHQVLLNLPDDLEAAVEGQQRHVALHAAELDAVLLARHFDEGADVAESLGLEVGQDGRGGLGLPDQFAHQVVARPVDRLDHVLGDQPAFPVSPVTGWNCVVHLRLLL